MKSKFQKKKDREKKVKKKLLLIRQAKIRKTQEVKKFEKLEREVESKPSAELRSVLDRLKEINESNPEII